MNAPMKVADKPLRQVSSVRELLVNRQAQSQLASVAAKHMSPERMMRVVANAIRTTPKLQECDPVSFLGALMHCASMGLEPNTPLGHAYLIPFENKRKQITEVQVVIGYKGFIDMARRSGQLASIHGDVVYSDDELWSHEYGSNQHLRHIPGPRKGERLGAYCFVKLRVGESMAEGHRFMTMDEIIRHRDQYSQGWKTAKRFGKTQDSPWNEANPAFEAMAIKTAVRALANRGEMPLSIEFLAALETDDAPADYRAFAMDPTGGLNSIDGDVVEEGHDEDGVVDPKQVTAETVETAEFQRDAEAPREKVVQERAEPAQERVKGEPRGAKAEGQAKPAPAPPAPSEAAQGEDFRVFNDIVACALDGEPVDQIRKRENDRIEAMRDSNPALFLRLMNELEAFEGETGSQARMSV